MNDSSDFTRNDSQLVWFLGFHSEVGGVLRIVLHASCPVSSNTGLITITPPSTTYGIEVSPLVQFHLTFVIKKKSFPIQAMWAQGKDTGRGVLFT